MADDFKQFWDSLISGKADIPLDLQGVPVVKWIWDAGMGYYNAGSEVDLTQANLETALDTIESQLETVYAGTETTARGFEQAFKQAIEFAEETHGLKLDIADQEFWQAVQQNVGLQGEERRRMNREAIEGYTQRAAAGGEATSKLAQSGVRNTGSAQSLQSETSRMYDVDIAEIDKQLESEMAQYERERGGYRQDKSRAIRAADLEQSQIVRSSQSGFERSMENIIGKDIDFSKYFAGDQSLVDTLGGADWFKDTLLTAPYKDAYRGVKEQQQNATEAFDESIWGKFEQGMENVSNAIFDPIQKAWDWVFSLF